MRGTATKNSYVKSIEYLFFQTKIWFNIYFFRRSATKTIPTNDPLRQYKAIYGHALELFASREGLTPELLNQKVTNYLHDMYISHHMKGKPH